MFIDFDTMIYKYKYPVESLWVITVITKSWLK